MRHPKTGTTRTAYMLTLSNWGIKDPKKWLLDHVDSVNYTTNYGGQKPLEIQYKGQKQYFTTYAEAAVNIYKQINGLLKEETLQDANSRRMQFKIDRLEKLLLNETIPANEIEEIKQKLEELKANL